MFGQYKRLMNRFEGVLTGKALEFGGSRIRTEATGYGVVYMMDNMLRHHGESIEGKICVVSGSGNVATFCAEKLIELGGKVVTLSDSGGFIHDPEGFTQEKLQWIMDLKNNRRGRIEEYVQEFGGTFHAGQRPWNVPCDLAFPCATQNEIELADAEALIKNGCRAISEGANMPSTPEAIHAIQAKRELLHAPSKAANAGGVGVSGLEMSQNSLRLQWTREEVDERLKGIIAGIHEQMVTFGTAADGHVDYFKGANIAGFNKVASAMIAYGVM
jgi:glutamate dehydrogenase (NADP+)